MRTILFLILPIFVYARISIQIIPATDNKDASVLITGSERGPVETIDINRFHLTENEVNENLKTKGYSRPDSVNKDLIIILKPVNARVISKDEKVERIVDKYYNTENCSSIIYEQDTNKIFEETLRTRWYETQDISIGRNIDIKISNDRLKLNSSWGEDDYVSKNIKLRSNDIPLSHIQNVSSVIHATLYSLEIRVDYKATLEGELFFQDLCSSIIRPVTCLESFKLEVNDYFHLLETFRKSVEAHQIIDISYYRDFKLTVTDMSNGLILNNNELDLEAS